MSVFRAGLYCCFLAFAGPVAALNIDLPGAAQLTREVDRDADTYFLPTAPFAEGRVPSEKLEGRVVRQAWRIEIEGEAPSTLNLLSMIREQMQQQGYRIILDCTATECGGFDFRFGIDVLPAPDMFVDLFDYHFLSGQNSDVSGAQNVSVLVSRAGQAGYVQLVRVGTGDFPKTPDLPKPEEGEVLPSPLPEPEAEPSENEQGLIATLLSDGHAVLPDLVFSTGSSALEEGSYASLGELAAFLNEVPDREVVLVGHTDAVGALEDNVALSRARAASVLERLVGDYGAPEGQVTSDGMGYLAPVATNRSEAGRRANRRVEAVLLSTGN